MKAATLFAINFAQSALGQNACSNPGCSNPPCAAPLVNDVGCTTVSGTEVYNHAFIGVGDAIGSNAHIFGPFEAGFSSKQDSLIVGWGCTDPSAAYDSAGGKDLDIAEASVAYECGIDFPRLVGSDYIGIVGYCGGRTSDYHFHRSFNCLYSESGGHSTQIGDAASHALYGKWEHFSERKLPYLDACGGHFGFTPESPQTEVYHYHVQDTAPFSIGCYGPSASGGLVPLATCRALYDDCGDGVENMQTKDGSVPYDRWCPCFDADGSNVGNEELRAISASQNWFYEGDEGGEPTPSATPAPEPAVACGDSEDWYYKKEQKNCEWVAENTETRCSKKGTLDGEEVEAKKACLKTCGQCEPEPTPTPTPESPEQCEDDESWYKKEGQEGKTCAVWVSKNPEDRCNKKGYIADGSKVRASEACCATCGTGRRLLSRRYEDAVV